MNVEFNPKLLKYRLYVDGSPTDTIAYLSEYEAKVKNYAYLLNRVNKKYERINYSNENTNILVLPEG